MSDALQDALARMDALVAKWREAVAESEWMLDPERGDGAISAAAASIASMTFARLRLRWPMLAKFCPKHPPETP